MIRVKILGCLGSRIQGLWLVGPSGLQAGARVSRLQLPAHTTAIQSKVAALQIGMHVVSPFTATENNPNRCNHGCINAFNVN